MSPPNLHFVPFVPQPEGKTESKNEDILHNWLQECSVSLSPTSCMMVIAFEERAVFLQREYTADCQLGMIIMIGDLFIHASWAKRKNALMWMNVTIEILVDYVYRSWAYMSFMSYEFAILILHCWLA